MAAGIFFSSSLRPALLPSGSSGRELGPNGPRGRGWAERFPGDREIETGLPRFFLSFFVSSPVRGRDDLLGPLVSQNLCFVKSLFCLSHAATWGKYTIGARWRKMGVESGGLGLGGYHPTSRGDITR